jgi:hypothetical protein
MTYEAHEAWLQHLFFCFQAWQITTNNSSVVSCNWQNNMHMKHYDRSKHSIVHATHNKSLCMARCHHAT